VWRAAHAVEYAERIDARSHARRVPHDRTSDAGCGSARGARGRASAVVPAAGPRRKDQGRMRGIAIVRPSMLAKAFLVARWPMPATACAWRANVNYIYE